LDASGVTFSDSSGLGRLALLVRSCRAAGQLLVLVKPSATFKTSICAAQMDSLFPMVESEQEAMKVVADHGAADVVKKEAGDGVLWVSFSRSLDAIYHDEMMSILESSISNSEDSHSLVVDLKEVGFIDSRAVGGLIRAWKMMTSRGGGMFLSGASPAVSEIISLLRLDKILGEWEGEVPG
jgi:anti-anti-sigma factor